MEKNYYVKNNSGKYSDNELPLLSVAMIAYNVANYIEEAIESVLCQKTNFKVELVIGEDCSTDNTRDLIQKYQKQYPEIINVLWHKKNKGLTPNSIATQNACKGKYIALLDGDDYWTNDLKLQKQVDFLEANSDFSACAHQSNKIFGLDFKDKQEFGSNSDADLEIEDTIKHRKFHTSSLVYRRSIWEETGGIPAGISSNERAIYPMLSIYGKIKYLGESMCVYRLSPTGLNSKISVEELETDLLMIPWLKKIDKNFPLLSFKSFLHLCMYTYPAKVSFKKLLKHYFAFAFLSFSYFPKNLGDIKYGTLHIFRNYKMYLKKDLIK